MTTAPLLGGLFVGSPSSGGPGPVEVSTDDVVNDSSVPGTTCTDALNALSTPTSTQVTNLSVVPGANVTSALNTLRSSTQIVNQSAVDGANVTEALNSLLRVLYTADKTSAAYTPAQFETGKTIPANSASAQTCTLTNSGWTVGDVITIWQKGAGQTTFVAGAGATILPSPSYQPKTLEVNAQVTAQYVAANTWLLSGDRLPV